jgi:hypothetical protein
MVERVFARAGVVNQDRNRFPTEALAGAGRHDGLATRAGAAARLRQNCKLYALFQG